MIRPMQMQQFVCIFGFIVHVSLHGSFVVLSATAVWLCLKFLQLCVNGWVSFNNDLKTLHMQQSGYPGCHGMSDDIGTSELW